MVNALVQAGVSQSFADLYVAMMRAFNADRPRTPHAHAVRGFRGRVGPRLPGGLRSLMRPKHCEPENPVTTQENNGVSGFDFPIRHRDGGHKAGLKRNCQVDLAFNRMNGERRIT
jgi:hypothetical protein